MVAGLLGWVVGCFFFSVVWLVVGWVLLWLVASSPTGLRSCFSTACLVVWLVAGLVGW